MPKSAHLWAVGFGNTGRAAQVRDEITRLACEEHKLILLDVAVVVRYSDGSLTLNGEAFVLVTHTRESTLARLLAGLAIAGPPLCREAVGALMSDFGRGAATVGISEDFVREVSQLIKPGSSVLFVLDEAGNMDAILHAIRGLGGTVLKTNVDLEQAKLIQSTLAASPQNDPEEANAR